MLYEVITVEASPTNFEDLGNLINGQIVPVSGKVALINNKNELPLYQIETSVERWANDWSNRIKVSSTQQYTVITSYSIHYTKLYDTKILCITLKN